MEAELQLFAQQSGGRVSTCICDQSLIPRDAVENIKDNPVAEWKEQCEQSLFQMIEQRRAKILSLVEEKHAAKELQAQTEANEIKEGRRQTDKKPDSGNHSVFTPDITRIKHALSRKGSYVWRNFASVAGKISRSRPVEAPRGFGPINSAPMGFNFQGL
ncbi:MAG: hypothetical protein M1816_003063 [Peltula sp. TS41687]|nr:MAG: hypothetical protein M1816_003063 [Peltula sp. TS41687]